MKSYFPQLSAHVERLGAPVRHIFTLWFRNFFVGYLPPPDVARVVDTYLFEGPKVGALPRQSFFAFPPPRSHTRPFSRRCLCATAWPS